MPPRERTNVHVDQLGLPSGGLVQRRLIEHRRGALWSLCGLTFELSGPEPEWRLAREADDDSERFAGQVPSRWRSARAKG